jgi:hypothetical protein
LGEEKMSDANPTNHSIAKCMAQISPELFKRYGRAMNCYRGQLQRTTDDLAIDPDIVPYLAAALLTEEELKIFQSQLPSIHWEEVKARAERIFQELQRFRTPTGAFHENWIGVHGIGA